MKLSLQQTSTDSSFFPLGQKICWSTSMGASSSSTWAMRNELQLLELPVRWPSPGQPRPIPMERQPSMLLRCLGAGHMTVSGLMCGAWESLHSTCTVSSQHLMLVEVWLIGKMSVDPTMICSGGRSSPPATILSFRRNWKASSTPCGDWIQVRGPGLASWKKPSQRMMTWFGNSQACNGLPGRSMKLKASLMSFRAAVQTIRFTLLVEVLRDGSDGQRIDWRVAAHSPQVSFVAICCPAVKKRPRDSAPSFNSCFDCKNLEACRRNLGALLRSCIVVLSRQAVSRLALSRHVGIADMIILEQFRTSFAAHWHHLAGDLHWLYLTCGYLWILMECLTPTWRFRIFRVRAGEWPRGFRVGLNLWHGRPGNSQTSQSAYLKRSLTWLVGILKAWAMLGRRTGQSSFYQAGTSVDTGLELKPGAYGKSKTNYRHPVVRIDCKHGSPRSSVRRSTTLFARPGFVWVDMI